MKTLVVSYQNIKKEDRDRIRTIESKPHIGYIRFLLCQRMNFSDIPKELLKLGFSPIEPGELYFYFRQVMFPVFQKHKIQRYYYHYKIDRESERLTFEHTFGNAEDDRKAFCLCVQVLEIEFFFANEILAYYAHGKFPVDEHTGEPFMKLERTNSLTDILQHPKRHIIEMMLADGKTPKHISAYLNKTFGIEVGTKEISQYASAFFKIRRRDLERTIDDLQEEKETLVQTLELIRSETIAFNSLSEKTSAIGETKKKIADLDSIIKRMQGHHSHHAYQAGLLEYAQIREIFADVMLRTHKRFVDIDDTQPETDAVTYLATVVGMMTKATEKIIAVDDKLSETTKKSVSEEMLEVVIPTLERAEREEREAREKYRLTQEHSSDPDILGSDD